MALTLSDYKASSENAIDRTVIDEFRKSSYLFDNLPFDAGANLNAGGAAWVYQYDRVSTEPTAATRAVGSEFSAQEAKVTAHTVELKIFGGKFSIDRTQVRTARYGDRLQFQLEQKVKATRAKFHDLFINGDSSSAGNALEFDGLDVILTSGGTEKTCTADLTDGSGLDANYKTFLDELFDMLSLVDGRPDVLLMNRTMATKLRSVAFRAGFFTQSEDAFGRQVNMFDGIPFVDLGDKPGGSNPVIANVSDSSLDTTTDIYAVRFGLDGVHGVAPESNEAFIRTYLPDLTQPGAVKSGEVEMVSAIAVKATRSAGVLRSIAVVPNA